MSFLRNLFNVFWAVFCITSSLVMRVITFSERIPVKMARTWFAPGIIGISGVKLKVTGTENIDPKQPCIYVANHESFLDIPLLFKAIPVNLYFVAKKEIKRLPFIGWYMMATGMIFLDRQNKKAAIDSMKKAGELIRNGKSVITFPEGTRSANHKVAPFKKGTFHLAMEAGVPLVPVGIKGSGKVWPSNKMKITPGEVRVRIGKPIKIDPQVDSMSSLKEKLQREVEALSA